MASNFYLNAPFSGLGTAVSTQATVAGIYEVEGKLDLPSIPAGSLTASAVVVVVNKNGSPVYTGSAGARGFAVRVPCAALDAITVVLSSAALVDLEKNAVKSNTSISQFE